jgi:hypothetical protein
MDEMTPGQWLAAAALTALVANYLCNWWTGYPFLYCSLGGLSMALYLYLGQLVLMAVCIGIIISVYRRDVLASLVGVGLFVCINNLPKLADMVLKNGGSCV